MRHFLSSIVLALLPCLTQAQSAPEQFRTMDDGRGWEAVGRLDIGGRGFCTGALIAPDLVLTAAHCLFDDTSRARFDAADITFRAGFRDGRAIAERGVRRALIPPGYVYEGRTGTGGSPLDLALLQLAQPIRSPHVVPFATGTMTTADATVGIVSYAHDRAEAPALQEVCGVLGMARGVWVLSCAVDFGSSGAPVFQMDHGVARIVSVVSAKAVLDDAPVAIASNLDTVLADLMATMASGGDSFQALAPGGVRVVTSGERVDTGARFVRP